MALPDVVADWSLDCFFTGFACGMVFIAFILRTLFVAWKRTNY